MQFDMAQPGFPAPRLAWRALRRLRRILLEPDHRHITWMLLRRPKAGFQPLNRTWENRYPRIFGFVKAITGAEASARILSFGCSTGEEVVTLRRLFPSAVIRGLDINPGNIEICRKRLRRAPDPAISFGRARSADLEPPESYDVIFCMAVLRDSRLTDCGLQRCDRFIRFEDFAEIVGGFERCLKPGGLLVIRHSNFRLCDAPAGAAFEVLLSLPIPPARFTPIFGPDNRLMPGVSYPDTVFRKTSTRRTAEGLSQEAQACARSR